MCAGFIPFSVSSWSWYHPSLLILIDLDIPETFRTRVPYRICIIFWLVHIFLLYFSINMNLIACLVSLVAADISWAGLVVLRLKHQPPSLVSILDCNELVPSGVASKRRIHQVNVHALVDEYSMYWGITLEVPMLIDGKPRTQAMSVPKQQPSSLSFVSMAGWSTNSSCPAALPFMVHILLYLSPSDYETDSQVFAFPLYNDVWTIHRAVMLSFQFGEAIYSILTSISHRRSIKLEERQGSYLGSYTLNVEFCFEILWSQIKWMLIFKTHVLVNCDEWSSAGLVSAWPQSCG